MAAHRAAMSYNHGWATSTATCADAAARRLGTTRAVGSRDQAPGRRPTGDRREEGRPAVDNPMDLGHERLIRAIETLEVLNIFFPWLGHSLILDTRHSAEAPPAVLLEPMVGSA